MLKEGYLYWDQIKIGVFTLNEDKLTYRAFKDVPLSENIAYPDGLFEMDRTVSPWVNLIDQPYEGENLWDWLKLRIFPENRENASFLLRNLGLSKYDPWEILKFTKGKTDFDSYWIEFKEGG